MCTGTEARVEGARPYRQHKGVSEGVTPFTPSRRLQGEI